MRKILLAAISTVILFSACQKNDSSCGNHDSGNIKESTGTITGRDMNKCSCCWGWVIEIDNVTYKFDKVPAGSTVNLETLSYPASVNLTWHVLPGNCSNRIEILAISQ
jgi:hypothetical protein